MIIVHQVNLIAPRIVTIDIELADLLIADTPPPHIPLTSGLWQTAQPASSTEVLMRTLPAERRGLQLEAVMMVGLGDFERHSVSAILAGHA